MVKNRGHISEFDSITLKVYIKELCTQVIGLFYPHCCDQCIVIIFDLY